MNMGQIGEVLQALGNYFSTLDGSVGGGGQAPVAPPPMRLPAAARVEVPSAQEGGAGASGMHPLMARAYAFAERPLPERLQHWILPPLEREGAKKVEVVATIEGGALVYVDSVPAVHVTQGGVAIPFDGTPERVVDVIQKIATWDVAFMVNSNIGLRALCPMCDVSGPHVTWMVHGHQRWGDDPVLVAADGRLMQVRKEGIRLSSDFEGHDVLKDAIDHGDAFAKACVENFRRAAWILRCP